MWPSSSNRCASAPGTARPARRRASNGTIASSRPCQTATGTAMSARSKPQGLTAAMPSSRTPIGPCAAARLKRPAQPVGEVGGQHGRVDRSDQPAERLLELVGRRRQHRHHVLLDEGLVDLGSGAGGGVLLVVLLGHAVEPVQPLGVVRRDAGDGRRGPAPAREQRRAGQRPRAAARPAERSGTRRSRGGRAPRPTPRRRRRTAPGRGAAWTRRTRDASRSPGTARGRGRRRRTSGTRRPPRGSRHGRAVRCRRGRLR